jgi:hypothetical protein
MRKTNGSWWAYRHAGALARLGWLWFLFGIIRFNQVPQELIGEGLLAQILVYPERCLLHGLLMLNVVFEELCSGFPIEAQETGLRIGFQTNAPVFAARRYDDPPG